MALEPSLPALLPCLTAPSPAGFSYSRMDPQVSITLAGPHPLPTSPQEGSLLSEAASA
jgi:hypothetical protein